MDRVREMAIRTFYIYYINYNKDIKTFQKGIGKAVVDVLGIRSDIPPKALLNEIRNIRGY